jgi:hypothetical protein
MPISTITLTSASTTTSAAVQLNWTGARPTTVAVTMPSTTGSLDFTLQYTLTDIERSGIGSSQAAWFNFGSSGLGTHYSTANLDVGGAGPTFTFLGPIAGVRLQSTNISSGPLTAFILQGDGG